MDLKDFSAARPEEYMWLLWAQAAPRVSYYMTVALNRSLRDQGCPHKHQQCWGVTQMSKYLTGPLDLRSVYTDSHINSVLCDK